VPAHPRKQTSWHSRKKTEQYNPGHPAATLFFKWRTDNGWKVLSGRFGGIVCALIWSNSMDTARMGLIDLHVKELRALPKKNFSYNIFTNGQLFKLGAIGYTSLNIINTLSSKDPVFAPENASRLGIAGLVYLGGALLGSFHRTYWEVGKRYRFVIVPIAPPDVVQRTNTLQ
jgi:hypothetical protein